MERKDQDAPVLAKEKSKVADALTVWSDETAPAGSTAPSLIRLDANETLVIFFTTSIVSVKLHYLDLTSLRSYVHCPEKDCLLCRLGRHVETRDLLPAYDAVNKVVGVLSVSANVRPHALRPQLKPILQRLKEEPQFVIGIRKLDNVRFSVATYPLSADADDGLEVIAAFMEQLESGQIDLGEVYARMTNEDLAAIPELAAAMALRGIKLP